LNVRRLRRAAAVILALVFWYLFYSATLPSGKTSSGTAKPGISDREISLEILRASIDTYKRSRGRYPESLDSLKEAGFIEEIPQDYGKSFSYDSEKGYVR
jgi:hypothetical protein